MKVNLFSQRSLHLFHLLLPFLCHGVTANTEIINFASSPVRTVDLPWDVVGNGSRLHPSDNERRWTLEPAALHTPLHQVCERDNNGATFTASSDRPPSSCPHELWVFLDLDNSQWASWSAFSLRLSWAASTPADFTITLYTPEELLARLSESPSEQAWAGSSPIRALSSESSTATTSHTTTRSRYARIRAVDAGVLIPSIRSQHSPPRSSPRPHPPLPLQPRVPFIAMSLPLNDEEDAPVGSYSPSHLTVAGSTPTMGSLADVEQAGNGTTVPFIVILEPLYLGLVPASLLPTVFLLVPLILAAALCVGWVTAYFEPFVQQARADGVAEARATAGHTDTKKAQ